MARIFLSMIIGVVMLGSCGRSNGEQVEETEDVLSEKTEMAGESIATMMMDEELVGLLERIDAGTGTEGDILAYRGTDVPSPVLRRWVREKQLQSRVYHSSGGTIRDGHEVIGSFYVAALATRVVFFYQMLDGDEFRLSDALIVEKKLDRIMTFRTVGKISHLFDPMDPNPGGERVEFHLGIVYYDEDHPLVYEQWFHPDAVIKIDPEAGTLELIEEVPEDYYVMIEGV